jgi:uncharacterized protein with HEPN domain
MTGFRSLDYIEHMLEAAQRSLSYVEGLNKADFFADQRTQQAVVMNMIILGEAAGKLMQSDVALVEFCSQIPWRSIKGMRNRIAHGYFDINLDVVWDTVQLALPPLVNELKIILTKLNPNTPT